MSTNGAEPGGTTPSASESQLNPRELARTLYRHKWVVLAITLLLPTATALYARRLPKTYEATATLEYNPTPTRPLGRDFDDVADPVGSYWTSREWYRTQNTVLASRAVTERVVRKLALHRDRTFFYVPEDRPFEPETVTRAAQVLQSRLNVNQQKETRLVDVTVEDRNPERARLIVNTLAQSYIEKMSEDRMRSTVEALEWLRRQLDDQREELQTSELALHTFKESNDVLSVSLEDRQNMVARNLESYAAAYTSARLAVIDLEAKLAALDEFDLSDPMTVPDVFEDSAMDSLREQYRTAAAEREEMSTRYGENHPERRSLDARMATLRDHMRDALQSAVSATRSSLTAAKSKEAAIKEALRKANSEGMALNRREIEYRKLERRASNDEKMYSLLLERTTETNLTRLIDLSKVMLLEPALEPRVPTAPRVPLYILGGAAVGLLLGLALVVVVASFDTTVKSPSDIENAGVPVLGILPAIDKATGNAASRSRRRNRARGHKYDSDRDLIVHTKPQSAIAECCRTIRTNLAFTTTTSELRTLVVTSAGPLEGKTTVAVSMAISLAQSGKRVLLVDTDLRRPRAHRTFNLRSALGVTSVLAREVTIEEAVQETTVPGLSLLTAGPIPPNPAELLQTPRFEELIEGLAAGFDRVVFDSPPLGAVIDAAIIGRQVGAAVLVVQAQQTGLGAAKSAIRQLRDVGAPIVGAIINNVELSSGQYGYGGYHYEYYGVDAPSQLETAS